MSAWQESSVTRCVWLAETENWSYSFLQSFQQRNQRKNTTLSLHRLRTFFIATKHDQNTLQLKADAASCIHRLTLKSYADCLMTSGAIQKGVPTNVFLLIWVSVSCPATPKSANFTSPCSDKSTLAAGGRRENKNGHETRTSSEWYLKPSTELSCSNNIIPVKKNLSIKANIMHVQQWYEINSLQYEQTTTMVF